MLAWFAVVALRRWRDFRRHGRWASGLLPAHTDGGDSRPSVPIAGFREIMDFKAENLRASTAPCSRIRGRWYQMAPCPPAAPAWPPRSRLMNGPRSLGCDRAVGFGARLRCLRSAAATGPPTRHGAVAGGAGGGRPRPVPACLGASLAAGGADATRTCGRWPLRRRNVAGRDRASGRSGVGTTVGGADLGGRISRCANPLRCSVPDIAGRPVGTGRRLAGERRWRCLLSSAARERCCLSLALAVGGGEGLAAGPGRCCLGGRASAKGDGRAAAKAGPIVLIVFAAPPSFSFAGRVGSGELAPGAASVAKGAAGAAKAGQAVGQVK
jgi:hypothetical protein